MPEIDFLAKWGVEILFGLLYLISGIGALIYATRKNKPALLVFGGIVYAIASVIFYRDGWRISPILFVLTLVLLFFGIKGFVQRKQ